MPEKQTLERARKDKLSGKRATTQAGEFVREEMHHMKEGKHGRESRQQAIAIGLSKARRAGVDLTPPGPGQARRKTRQSARSAFRLGQEEGELSDKKSAKSTSTGRRSGTTGRATSRRATVSRAGTATRGTKAKTGGRTAAAGRTGRAKTAAKKTARTGTTRRGSSSARGRTSSRAKK
jgi:uncharacterized protein DUF6496